MDELYFYKVLLYWQKEATKALLKWKDAELEAAREGQHRLGGDEGYATATGRVQALEMAMNLIKEYESLQNKKQ